MMPLFLSLSLPHPVSSALKHRFLSCVFDKKRYKLRVAAFCLFVAVFHGGAIAVLRFIFCTSSTVCPVMLRCTRASRLTQAHVDTGLKVFRCY